MNNRYTVQLDNSIGTPAVGQSVRYNFFDTYEQAHAFYTELLVKELVFVNCLEMGGCAELCILDTDGSVKKKAEIKVTVL